MKKYFFLLLMAFLLMFLAAACGSLPGLSFLNTNTPFPSPTQNLTPSATIPPPPTDVPTPTITPSSTPTIRPTSTPKVYVPSAPGTPVIDMGFAPIALEDASQLSAVFQAMHIQVRHAALSGDGEKLFISTSDGLYVFDKTGQPLAHWPTVFTFDLPCQSCLSVNRDGSEFALLARNAGQWEAQLYAVVDGKKLQSKLVVPLSTAFEKTANPGRVALSPDSGFLAYQEGNLPVRVFNLKTGRQVFNSDEGLTSILFSPDGAFFIARQQRSLQFISTADWGKPNILLLSDAATPFALSPDGKRLVVVFGAKLRSYDIKGFKVLQEIPLPAAPRQWQLTFISDTVVQGYNLQWDAAHQSATETIAEWDFSSGKNTRLDQTKTDSPSPLPRQWNTPLTLTDTLNGLSVGQYNNFGFIGDEMLLANSLHAVCWVRYLTAEQNCVADNEHVMFSASTIAYKEVLEASRTRLEKVSGEPVLDISPYRIGAIDRTGQWILVNLNGQGTDMYGKGHTFPEESVGGGLLGFAENLKLLAFTTQTRAQTNYITVIDKATGNTLAQKKDIYLYAPLLIKKDGSLILLKLDLGKKQTIINIMTPPAYEISELTRLSLPAQVTKIAVNFNEDLFAFALEDGSIRFFGPDFDGGVSLQAFDSPVQALDFSPSGRYLAAASQDGIKIFVLRPELAGPDK